MTVQDRILQVSKVVAGGLKVRWASHTLRMLGEHKVLCITTQWIYFYLQTNLTCLVD